MFTQPVQPVEDPSELKNLLAIAQQAQEYDGWIEEVSGIRWDDYSRKYGGAVHASLVSSMYQMQAAMHLDSIKEARYKRAFILKIFDDDSFSPGFRQRRKMGVTGLAAAMQLIRRSGAEASLPSPWEDVMDKIDLKMVVGGEPYDVQLKTTSRSIDSHATTEVDALRERALIFLKTFLLSQPENPVHVDLLTTFENHPSFFFWNSVFTRHRRQRNLPDYVVQAKQLIQQINPQSRARIHQQFLNIHSADTLKKAARTRGTTPLFLTLSRRDFTPRSGEMTSTTTLQEILERE